MTDMDRPLPFALTDNAIERADAWCVALPGGIRSADQLLQTLYQRLLLPGYFGFNWNALSDCLRSLEWVDVHDVIVSHAELPALPEPELVIYLDVLADAVQSWGEADEHRLIVSFPKSAEPELRRLLSAQTGQVPPGLDC